MANSQRVFNQLFFILAFIEGGGVMCVELCSAKLLAPFFGTSIYVWASVLGITLTALMSGYYLGGYLSQRVKNNSTILWMMIVGGFLVSTTPILAKFTLPITIELNLILGSITSLILLLFFPLLFFGATSPLLINFLSTNATNPGKISGNIYAVSTLGGIITTFIIGFYTLPTFGINYTLFGYGLLILSYTTFIFVRTKKFHTSLNLIIILAALSLNFHDVNNYEKLLYKSEGILGEVKVIERTYLIDDSSKTYRELLVNNICQTMMNVEDPAESYWKYVDVLAHEIKSHKNGNKTLLMGLGGGTLFKKLIQQNLAIDVVEIDGRIAQVAQDYFELEEQPNLFIDDARHFINTNEKKYDVIIFDLFQAETPPSHLMTKNAFERIKSQLSEDGIFIINFYGYITGEKGFAARSVYKTFVESKFKIKLIPTEGSEDARNLIFLATKNEFIPKLAYSTPIIKKEDINLNEAVLLTDGKPKLEHLYVEAALDWRKNYNQYNAKLFLKRNK